MVRHKVRFVRVSTRCILRVHFSVNASHRSMETVSEKLGWPVKVDYPSANFQDRKAFETIFLDLLKLQDL